MSKSFLIVSGLLALSLLASGCNTGDDTGTTPSTDSTTETSTESSTEATIDRSTPEAAVQGFYDAMMAGDQDAALEYIDPSVVDSEDFQDSWAELSEWTYKTVSVLGSEGNFVEIEMTIEIEGEEDSGTDEVELVQVDGEWWIVDLPS